MESSILHADYSDAKVVQNLLDIGANVNVCSELGENALHLAIRKHTSGISCMDSIHLLLNAGIDVNLVNHRGLTALDFAVHFRFLKIVDAILQYGAVVNRDDCRYSVLTVAGKEQDEAIFKLLLDHGASVDFQNLDGSTPMNFIGFLTDYSIMVAVVERTTDINHRSALYSTPLCHAAYHGNAVLARLLLEAGADSSITTRPRFSTPLHEALSNNSKGTYDVAKVLLKHGLNVNDRDLCGVTALLCALSKCDIKVIKLLSNYGADFTVKDYEGNSTLHRAVENSSEEVISFVLDKGIDVNIKNHKGRTALHAAAEYGTYCGSLISPNTCHILLDRGADIWSKDNYERTPLSTYVEIRNSILHLYSRPAPPRAVIGLLLVAHIAKLDYCDVVIDENDRQLIEHDLSLKDHYQDYILLASKEEMSILARNKDVVSSINRLPPVLCGDMYIYFSSMQAKFQKEVWRQKQLKKVEKIINGIMGFNNPSHPICRSIASSLKEEDLDNF